MNGAYDTFAEAYRDLLEEVALRPTSSYEGRDGEVNGINNVNFTIRNPLYSLFNNVARPIKASTIEAECDMLFSTSDKVMYVPWYKPYCNGVTSKSMYGQYVAPQIRKVVNLLKNNEHSRQAFISILNNDNNPYTDIQDVPCAIGIQFIVNKYDLDAIAIMRSQDVYLGTTYDVPMFINLQQVIANELNLNLGTYTHIAMFAQLYTQHKTIVDKMLQNRFVPRARRNRLSVDEQFDRTQRYMEDICNDNIYRGS